LLLTDAKQNLSDFFVIDKEVVTYSSSEECLEKINWLLSNPVKLEEIARAGQKKTLSEHSLEKRIYQLHKIISNSL
jgi:spore maturation protein CgeB